ncbi:hypothetical protein GCM10010245_66780 [Streptomyces spectabilis]|nr:hypothetical protein GCM10010245_66780 [Streptomyces spectabilis]
MSEAYATTVATVASVIILVLAVEVNARRPQPHQGMDEAGEIDSSMASLFANGAIPSRQQIEENERRIAPLRVRGWHRTAVHVYVLSAMVVVIPLFTAECAALEWLAEERKGDGAGVAIFCYRALRCSIALYQVASPMPP